MEAPWSARHFVPGDEDPRDAALHEVVVGGGTVWTGKVIRVEDLSARIPDGRVEPRDIVRHPGGVGVVALTEDGLVAMVRQYRTPFNHVTVEIPAGKLDAGEEPEVAARRELCEETGFVARELAPLTRVAASPGCSDELVHVYLARGLSFAGAHPDDDEFLNVDMVPLPELVDAALAGELADAKSVAGVLAANEVLRREAGGQGASAHAL